MKEDLLKLVPKRYFCPYCGEWHSYNSANTLGFATKKLGCEKQREGYDERCTTFYFEKGRCYYKTIATCRRADFDMEGNIPIEEIIESADEPRVTFSVPFTTASRAGKYECFECVSKDSCLICKLGDQADSRNIRITFSFEFNEEDYKRYSKVHEKKRQQENKEDNTMATSIFEQLYEHSPKENIELAKNWTKKYKNTLKWAIPVVSIYAAYRILNSKNSKLTITNIEDECKKTLGFVLDKKAVKELTVIGGLSAGACVAIKAITSFQKKEVSVEDIEEGMEKLDETSKKFAWIQPKTEALFPVAISVITVYLMTQEPEWFKKVKGKVSSYTGSIPVKAEVYMEMVKLFVADKLNVKLDNPEEVKKFKKFAILAVIVGISMFLNGKKILKNKDTEEEEEPKNEKMDALIKQLTAIMKKLMPSAFAGISTFLISKKVLEAKKTEETSEEITENPEEEDME